LFSISACGCWRDEGVSLVATVIDHFARKQRGQLCAKANEPDEGDECDLNGLLSLCSGRAAQDGDCR
jgi:hypothetical protein